MQKLKYILKLIFKTVCILFVIILFGFIGLICYCWFTDVQYLSGKWSGKDPKYRQQREYMYRNGQLIYALYEFVFYTEFDPNEIKNLFEIKKLLLEPRNIDEYDNGEFEKLREKSKYFYLNPNIDLWRKAVLSHLENIGKEKKFEEENEIAAILCDPEGIYKDKFPMIRFSYHTSLVESVPVDWLEPNAEAQKEWEAYERSLSEAGAK